MVPVKNLVALYSLVGPPPVVIGGKKVTFVPPDPVALVAAMRAELDAMLAAAPQKAIPDAEGLINYLRVTATAAEWNLKKSGDHFIKMEDVKRLRDAADALTAANERADEAEAQGDIDAQASYEWRERAHKAERAVKDYEEWGEDVKRLTRQLDVEMHGDGAAKQASLCDLIGMHTRAVETIKAETVAAFRTAIFAACEGAQEDWPEDVPYARGYRSCAKRIAAQAEDAFRALSPATAPMTKGPQHG